MVSPDASIQNSAQCPENFFSLENESNQMINDNRLLTPLHVTTFYNCFFPPRIRSVSLRTHNCCMQVKRKNDHKPIFVSRVLYIYSLLPLGFFLSILVSVARGKTYDIYFQTFLLSWHQACSSWGSCCSWGVCGEGCSDCAFFSLLTPHVPQPLLGGRKGTQVTQEKYSYW